MNAGCAATALVMLAGIWGCSAGENSGGAAEQAEAPIGKDRIVASIPADEAAGAYELVWGETGWVWNGQEIFAAVHATEVGAGDYIASIYRRVDQGYELLRQIRSDASRFEEPVFFRVAAEPTGREQHLIVVSEVFYGTAHLRREHIFRFTEEAGIEPVEFVPAWESYGPRLGAGEGIWKDGENEFGGGGMTFTFYIWHEWDANCCPTAGRVTGSYALRKDDGSHGIVAENYDRQPYRHPDAR